MRAVVCEEYGPPEGLQVREVPVRPATAGQVQVRMAAAAVNFPDVLICANQYQVSVPLPFIPGSEFAGVGTEVGDGVSGFAVGDRGFGSTMTCGFCEYVTAPADVFR